MDPCNKARACVRWWPSPAVKGPSSHWNRPGDASEPAGSSGRMLFGTWDSGVCGHSITVLYYMPLNIYFLALLRCEYSSPYVVHIPYITTAI